MGKIKHKKHTYHSSAPNILTEDKRDIDKTSGKLSLSSLSFQKPINEPLQNNIFRNVVITPSALKQQLLPDSNPHKERKLLTREWDIVHKAFKEELDKQKHVRKKFRISTRQLRIQMRDAKFQKKASVLNDWEALQSALSDINRPEESSTRTPCSTSKGRRERFEKSEGRKRFEMQMQEDMTQYSFVLQNSDQSSDVFETLNAKLKLKLQSE